MTNWISEILGAMLVFAIIITLMMGIGMQKRIYL
jgi:hypothetical protein